MGQLSMFPELVPDEPDQLPLLLHVEEVARPVGWVLVATRRMPRGWHRIKTWAEYSTVVTFCGITGHVVPEGQRRIIPCSLCQQSPD